MIEAKRFAHSPVLALLFAFGSACDGEVSAAGAGPIADGPLANIGSNGSADGVPVHGAAAMGQDNGAGPGANAGGCGRSAETARAVMLDDRQYRNALEDLVGYSNGVDRAAEPPGLETELDVLDRPWVTTAVLDRVMRDAEAATESLRGRTADFMSCPDLLDESCVRGAMVRLARSAFARPPSGEEIDRVMAVRGEALTLLPEDGGESAALIAVQTILAAPSTFYRPEFLSTPQNGRRTLSSHERAAALAAFLLDSVPDRALMAAADDGSLMTDAGLRAQVTRLLSLPRVQHHLTGLLLNGYRVTRVFESPKDDALFPEFTPALMNSMFEESRRFVEDILWTRGAPVAELMTESQSYLNALLADHYGLAAGALGGGGEGDFTLSVLPPGRRGLLTQASVLSGLARTDKTSVVARGLFVRRDLLCLPKIPAPPDSVQAQVSEQLSMKVSETELAQYRAATSPCNGCHQQFDRFGLALEGFDPIGRDRTPAPEPIDLMGLAPLTGWVETPEDLVDVLVDEQRFTQCMAERLLDYALSSARGGTAYCEQDALHGAIAASNGTMSELVHAIVTHPVFLSRVEEAP